MYVDLKAEVSKYIHLFTCQLSEADMGVALRFYRCASELLNLGSRGTGVDHQSMMLAMLLYCPYSLGYERP